MEGGGGVKVTVKVGVGVGVAEALRAVSTTGPGWRSARGNPAGKRKRV